MNRPAYVIERLAGHDRTQFSCGVAALDGYFSNTVSQDVRRRVATCYVAVAPGGAIAGFYTLAASSIVLADLPEQQKKKLPRYPSVPVVLMGRLAVDSHFAGTGLGGALLMDALMRCADAEVGAYAMLVNAKDESAAKFYRHHGFIPFEHEPLRLFLPIATALQASNAQ